MKADGSSATAKARLLDRYRPAPSDRLQYDVGPGAEIVAERESAYTLYRVAVTASDGTHYRHLLVVPTNVSAASFDVSIAILEEDSLTIDAGHFDGIGRLAAAVQGNYRRYRTFPPPPALNRFCM